MKFTEARFRRHKRFDGEDFTEYYRVEMVIVTDPDSGAVARVRDYTYQIPDNVIKTMRGDEIYSQSWAELSRAIRDFSDRAFIVLLAEEEWEPIDRLPFEQ